MAREIKASTPPFTSDFAAYFQAQGYLACLDGEEVKDLVEALKFSPCQCHVATDYTCERCGALLRFYAARE